ncbi:MAG: RNA-binding protein [Acidimicrobiia bacterium]|nr:RNA-binding protein [Acidimicrobiia bacterium]MDH5294185.1 RNA-binding protein [Acidimicrobiia bacterium]
MNIYVGNLPFRFSDEDLAALFRRHGEVESASIIMDRDSGRSRGFGFVTMPNDDEARNAISELDGADNAGRRLTVNEARPRTERPRGGGDRGDRGGDRGRGGRSYDNRDRDRRY